MQHTSFLEGHGPSRPVVEAMVVAKLRSKIRVTPWRWSRLLGFVAMYNKLVQVIHVDTHNAMGSNPACGTAFLVESDGDVKCRFAQEQTYIASFCRGVG